jgi:hypothetical protein
MTPKQILQNVFITGLLFFSFSAQALKASVATTQAYEELTQAQSETYKYSYYFVFGDTEGDAINLSAFKRVAAAFPLPAVDYDRDNQFGEWIKPDKNSCLTTRGVVLERDSSVKISVNDKCTVTNGAWYDPYTDKNYTDAADIQIDHVVALKNAYMTGGHTWDKAKRCLYANYLGNNFHLLPVNGPENMKKSDKSPLEYVPPNKEFVCEYLRTWLEIKYIWNLKMTPREITAIQNEILQNSCTEKDMTISMKDVEDQRQYMEANKNLCQ